MTSNGLILIDKPEGISSAGVVAKVKHRLSRPKTGHAGTLDPFATGLLPICFGRATKLIDKIRCGKKSYSAELTLGVLTDTQDATGEIISQSVVPKDLTIDNIRDAARQFVGPIMQTPPMFSAKKVNGIRLYKLARKKIEVIREPREVHIYSLKVTDCMLPRIVFNVDCSEGTYVRTLGVDLAAAIGLPGMLSKLRRTRVGEFSVDQAVAMSEFVESGSQIDRWILPCDLITRHLKRLFVKNESEYKFRQGIYMTADDFIFLPVELQKDEQVNVYDLAEKYLGLGLSLESSENIKGWTLKTHKLIDI